MRFPYRHPTLYLSHSQILTHTTTHTLTDIHTHTQPSLQCERNQSVKFNYCKINIQINWGKANNKGNRKPRAENREQRTENHANGSQQRQNYENKIQRIIITKNNESNFNWKKFFSENKWTKWKLKRRSVNTHNSEWVLCPLSETLWS